MHKIVLSNAPKSNQHIYKIACRPFACMYMSKEGKEIKKQYQIEAKSQYRGKPLEKELCVELDLFFGTKRKVDVDNFCKIIFDSLTGICYYDDSQVKRLSIEKHYDKESPRCEIIIKEL